MDHTILSRTTALGNTSILVIVESFAGFPHLISVKDTTTETTAKAIVNNVIPFWGAGWTLYSDKAPSFMSGLFAQINTVLGIRHITAAARTARANGKAEAMVKRVSEHLKFYAKNDYSIEEVIPLIEMNLRAVPYSKLSISPYELVFGRLMPLGIPADPQTSSSEVNTDRVAYYNWLVSRLQSLNSVKTDFRCIKMMISFNDTILND